MAMAARPESTENSAASRALSCICARGKLIARRGPDAWRCSRYRILTPRCGSTDSTKRGDPGEIRSYSPRHSSSRRPGLNGSSPGEMKGGGSERAEGPGGGGGGKALLPASETTIV